MVRDERSFKKFFFIIKLKHNFVFTSRFKEDSLCVDQDSMSNPKPHAYTHLGYHRQGPFSWHNPIFPARRIVNTHCISHQSDFDA
jgi:hypothetical protein